MCRQKNMLKATHDGLCHSSKNHRVQKRHQQLPFGEAAWWILWMEDTGPTCRIHGMNVQPFNQGDVHVACLSWPPDQFRHLWVGGWATPLKNMSSSIGMMKFPTEWENTPVMFQSPPISLWRWLVQSPKDKLFGSNRQHNIQLYGNNDFPGPRNSTFGGFSFVWSLSQNATDCIIISWLRCKTTLIQFVVGMFTLPSHGWFMTLFFHVFPTLDRKSADLKPPSLWVNPPLNWRFEIETCPSSSMYYG